MRDTKLTSISRYNSVPKILEEDFGFMVMPFCPEFKVLHSYLVKSTDTISGLAREFYGDSRYQWAILSANELSFPPKLETGATILIPDAEEVFSYVG